MQRYNGIEPDDDGAYVMADEAEKRITELEAALNRIGGSPPPGTVTFAELAAAQERYIAELSSKLLEFDQMADDFKRAADKAEKRISELTDEIENAMSENTELHASITQYHATLARLSSENDALIRVLKGNK